MKKTRFSRVSPGHGLEDQTGIASVSFIYSPFIRIFQFCARAKFNLTWSYYVNPDCFNVDLQQVHVSSRHDTSALLYLGSRISRY